MKLKKTLRTIALACAALFTAAFLAGCPEPNNTAAQVTPEVEPGTVGILPDELLSASELAKTLDAGNEKVILFYYRGDGSYSKWGLWLWADGGDGQPGYTDTDGKFQKDSTTGIGYIFLDSSILTTATEAMAAITNSEHLNFIIRDANWAKDPGSDQLMDLTTGAKHFMVLSGDNTVYTISDEMKATISSASMESITTMKVQLGVKYGLETSASDNGFTLTADDGTTIAISDVVNYSAQTDRSKNNTATLLVTLASKIDTSKVWTLSHEKFGKKEVATSAVVAEEIGDLKYTGDDLGLTLNGTKATFKVWAPTASDVQILLYSDVSKIGTFKAETVAAHAIGSTTETELLGEPLTGYPAAMTKDASTGVWSKTEVDVSGAKYYKYKITVAGITYYVCDIYAKAAAPDSIASQIVDINSDSNAKPDGWETTYTNPFKGTTYNEAVIFEMHIRDWSRAVVADSTGKFLEFADDTIINHLKDLGITHVQILPMFDYAQVNSDTSYNWGYNPYHYNVPEGRYVDYSTNPDGTAAVSQMRYMIKKLHDAGIAVIMDVVFNHTSGTGGGSLYDSTVPYYYYRMNSDGSYSNGSGCGNETNSEAPMFKKYMIDSLKHWMNDYHINGFRFDLMGLHSKETMEEIGAALKTIDSSVLVYGEPWTGGTSPVSNTSSGAGENFGAFDDDYRDAIKGAEFGGFNAGQVQGVFADSEIATGLTGKTGKNKRNTTSYTGHAMHYAECHDNFTLYDKLVYSLDIDSAKTADSKGEIATVFPDTIDDEDFELVKAEDKLAAAFVILGQGTPFLNGGQEFLRTKKGDPDSYAADKKGGITWTNEDGDYNIDDVNSIDLSMKTKNADVYNTYKALIALRKSSSAFTAPTKVSAKKVNNTKGVTTYTVTDGTDTYNVYFNATSADVTIDTTGYTKVVDVTSGTPSEGTTLPATVGAKNFVILKK